MSSQQKIICPIGIGDNADSSPRNLGYISQGSGWRGVVSSIVQPLLDAGFRRFLLHNPGGLSVDASGQKFMDFNQATAARRDPRTAWLWNDFVPAWHPITRQQDVEVIAYIGSPERAPYNTWSDGERVLAVDIFDYAGMSLGLDATADARAGGATYRMVCQRDLAGRKTYVNACPTRWSCVRHLPAIVEEGFHETFTAQQPPQNDWLPRPDELSGEYCRWQDQPPTGHTWQDYTAWARPFVQKCIAAGHTAIIGCDPKQVTYQDLAA